MFDKIFEILQWAFEALVPFVILQPYERGVLIRLGAFNREVGPGFHWKVPLHFDMVHYENVVSRTERLTGLATTTADGKCIGFDAVVTYSIADIVKALLQVNDLKDAIADTCAGVIGNELAKAEWSAIWNATATEDLTKVCRKRGWKWGIEIEAVQLVGVALVKNLRISGNTGHSGGAHFNIQSLLP